MEDNINLRWRKSSYSGNGGGNCVEVADQAARVLVRDTKQDGAGPVLRFTPAVWLRFADEVKRSLAPAPNRGPADAGRGTLNTRECPYACPASARDRGPLRGWVMLVGRSVRRGARVFSSACPIDLRFRP